MTTPDYLRLCEEGCPIRHYENCRHCFGFGHFVGKQTGDLIPVTAAEAHGSKPLPDDRRPCPECGSTEAGAPVLSWPPCGCGPEEPAGRCQLVYITTSRL